MGCEHIYTCQEVASCSEVRGKCLHACHKSNIEKWTILTVSKMDETNMHIGGESIL